MNPRVEVIVPCSNHGHLLESCVRSVLSQEKVEVRVVIIDDASTDATEQVGRRLASLDSRVEYRRHQVRRGHVATCNEGLAQLTAAFCLLLTADDLLTPGSLMRATRLMTAHPEVGLTYGRDITFTHSAPFGAARSGEHCGHRIMGYSAFLYRSCRLGQTPIQSSTAVVRTSLHRQVGNYLPDLPHTGSTEVCLRLAAHAAVCELDADQAFRRVRADTMNPDHTPLRHFAEQKKAFDVHFNAYRRVRPEIASLEPILNRTIGQAAFWRGARAFDDNDVRLCDAYLACAAATWPDLASWEPFRQFRWKRRIGPVGSRWVETLAVRIRAGAFWRGRAAGIGSGVAAR
ncbi:MAG: glycosyltransferase family 2 protein [Acidobacteriota bacterium]